MIATQGQQTKLTYLRASSKYQYSCTKAMENKYSIRLITFCPAMIIDLNDMPK